jgi:hypothetical protein
VFWLGIRAALAIAAEALKAGDYAKERHEIFASETIEQLIQSIEETTPEEPRS